MNCFINYERLNPDTVSGEQLKVTFHYSTLDIKEMNEFEEMVKERLSSGKLVIFKNESEEEGMNERNCENCKHHTENGCTSWECEYEPEDENAAK